MRNGDDAPEAKRLKKDNEQSVYTVSLFNVDLLRAKLEEHFRNLEQNEKPTSIFTETRLYQVDEIFGNDRYWKNNIQRDRFDGSSERGILYRPEIVDDLVAKVEHVFGKNTPTGVMVKGPQGIGKSHSLVNLIRKLQYGSKGKYLVTFIPDCKGFEYISDFYDNVCSSFGTSTEELKFHPELSTSKDFYTKFVAKMELFLGEYKKHWVIVFDQINTLFAREKAETLGDLKFPYNVFDSIMRVKQITSIISASANNEISSKGSHRGFKEYNHRFSMNEEEVKEAFPVVVSEGKLDVTMQVTGGVPLQVEILSKDNFIIDKYNTGGSLEIRTDLCKLMKPPKTEIEKQAITDSAVACVLLLKVTEAVDFDRKYSAYEEETGYYKPVYPLVLDAYQEFFWASILKTLDEKEGKILDICSEEDTTNDTRSRFFELLVIMRCLKYTGVAELNREGIQLTMPPCKLADRFEDRLPGKNGLPGKGDLIKDGIYVPYNPNFPAIDFIWKEGKTVWGVQVHTNVHRDVLPDFTSMCRKANWHELFTDKIYLLYLSPKDVAGAGKFQAQLPPAVPSADELRVQPPRAVAAAQPDRLPITVIRALKNDLTCLQDLIWPERL